ncbi:LysR family transcriptional regulator [Tissierella sp. Yu-01]|uniref:LysR family transcriptional regulator n=1 Tax=Tissierella sp. Yu-01 TaxID=3035694 RepID=UPI00240D59C4|nr:LysR family transcriptional regulator [Tissierella sp. Yu-01]WFA08735.1 LysR family transcriptional regulator [Tissierella sp. Yu-01]
MDINHLEEFVAVAECGSINKAANKLYISQPHLSNIIKDLEKSIGFELFKRTNRGVKLTPAGEYFLKHSKTILNEIKALREFSPTCIKISDKLRVSMTKFTHTMESFNEVCDLSENIDEFTYVLNEGTTRDVIMDIAKGYTDVGVIHYDINEEKNIHTFLEKSELSWKTIARFKPEICISKHHDLIKQGKTITLDALKDYGFVRYLGQYEDFIYNITKKGHHMDLNNSNKIIYVYGRATLMQLISTTNCYTIGITEFDNQDPMFQVLSVPIEGCENSIQFEIITRKNAVLDKTAQKFIDNVTARYVRLSEKNRMQKTSE